MLGTFPQGHCGPWPGEDPSWGKPVVRHQLWFLKSSFLLHLYLQITAINLLDITTACGLLLLFPKQPHAPFSRKMVHTNRPMHTYRQGWEQGEPHGLFQPKPFWICDLMYSCVVLSGALPLARYLPSPALQAARDTWRFQRVSIRTFPRSGVSIRALAWLPRSSQEAITHTTEEPLEKHCVWRYRTYNCELRAGHAGSHKPSS